MGRYAFDSKLRILLQLGYGWGHSEIETERGIGLPQKKGDV